MTVATCMGRQQRESEMTEEARPLSLAWGGDRRRHGKALGSPRRAPDKAPKVTDGDGVHGAATDDDSDDMGSKKDDNSVHGAMVVAERV